MSRLCADLPAAVRGVHTKSYTSGHHQNCGSKACTSRKSEEVMFLEGQSEITQSMLSRTILTVKVCPHPNAIFKKMQN